MPGDIHLNTHAYHEHLIRGAVRSEHIVHFFDDDDARERVVGAFVRRAMSRKQSVLVVARPALWSRLAVRLHDDRVSVAPDARLVVLDADVTLAAIMRHGRFDPSLFADTVAPLVMDLGTAAPAGLAAYGEMVDILASEGNIAAASKLEAAWNGLLARVSMTLLCGYASAHFALAEREMMSAICAAHTRVDTDSPDALGRWLVERRDSEALFRAS